MKRLSIGGAVGEESERSERHKVTPYHSFLNDSTIVVTFVGTHVAIPPRNVDNNDCQHQDLFDSTLRGGESPAHM